MIYLSEGLLYISFAILVGSLLLRLVPEHARPAVHVPNTLLLACAIAIPILSFVPLHKLAQLFAKEFEMSYVDMMKSLLLEVNSGKAWIWTTVGSIGLAVLLGLKSFRNDKHTPKVALFVTLLLIVWLGYASHASALSSFKGIVVHTLHFLGFSVWIGILFVVSWFAKDENNWTPFLKWFSPVAIISVLITLIAGFTLMTFTTPQYVNAWMIPYGQMLLIKHVLILPLLLFAYTNGFGYKRAAKLNSDFNPKRWLKIESIIALLVLAATAIMGQQSPPHNLQETLQSVSPSPLFTAIYKGSFSPDMLLQFTIQLESVLMFVAALIMIAGVIWTHRSNRLIPSFMMGVLSAVFLYFGLMFSIA
ncbi:CopD family protein [Paenibacillus sp. GSMTC-2017]|uniref:copper resistance D family protein n=1 Tax=Paenibacillus sp. GSMTC-2017 TaxID=2794350 RepID=UPI0018D9F413|nr:CopD family protein [Paenibacillus sp. GSMTC-2017]MBH5317095.1 CopD family protein [Paenibacillus sp. GSMTC-2017]